MPRHLPQSRIFSKPHSDGIADIGFLPAAAPRKASSPMLANTSFDFITVECSQFAIEPVLVYSTRLDGANDIFVTKLNPAWDALIYSTYIDG